MLPLLLLVLLAAALPDAAPSVWSPETRVPPAELRQDFEIARHAFEEGHPGLYRFTPKPSMDSVFDAAEKQLDRPMNAWEFYRVMAPVVASIRCGHSRCELPDTLNKQINSTRHILPVQVRILAGRVWIYRDGVTDTARLEGDELLSVNGVNTATLLATMDRATPRDGFIPTHVPQVLRGLRFCGTLERLYGFDGRYEVTLRDRTGRTESLTLEGATVPDLTARFARRHPEDSASQTNVEFQLYDGGQIARLKLRGFGGTTDDSGKVDVRRFFQASFDTLRARGTRSLILDLRDNGGGEDALGRILFSYLVDQPFKYYDDLVLNDRGFSFARYSPGFDSISAQFVTKGPDGRYHATGHPNWGTQQPMAPHFAGRVYVLVNGLSFSTTCEFMSHARDAKRATFVGEESGGAYVGNTSGGVVRVVLPHTHVQVGVPIMRYDLAVSPATPFGRGIQPDVPVTETIDDLLAGKDKALAKALELARSGR